MMKSKLFAGILCFTLVGTHITSSYAMFGNKFKTFFKNVFTKKDLFYLTSLGLGGSLGYNKFKDIQKKYTEEIDKLSLLQKFLEEGVKNYEMKGSGKNFKNIGDAITFRYCNDTKTLEIKMQYNCELFIQQCTNSLDREKKHVFVLDLLAFAQCWALYNSLEACKIICNKYETTSFTVIIDDQNSKETISLAGKNRAEVIQCLNQIFTQAMFKSLSIYTYELSQTDKSEIEKFKLEYGQTKNNNLKSSTLNSN